jgi:hypothetical protein
MIKGKVILGKSINSRGSNYNYYYLDTKDLRLLATTLKKL